MNYTLNDDESRNDKFAAYRGKVLSIEKYKSTSIEGKTTHSAFTGSDFNVISSSFIFEKAKVLLISGRIKEFDLDGVEMQESDEVEFVTGDKFGNIYVKNITTDKSEIVEPTYSMTDISTVFGFSCLGGAGYGIYSIIKAHGFLASIYGVLMICASLSSLILFSVILSKRLAALNSEFQTKVLATGMVGIIFKSPKTTKY